MTPATALRLAILASLAVCGAGCRCGGTGTCADPKALLGPDGRPSGMVVCDDGAINRIDDVVSSTVHTWRSCPSDLADGFPCTLDAHCTEGSHGFCVGTYDYRDDFLGCVCWYSCADDTDCAADQACAPSVRLGPEHAPPDHGVCMPAGCRTGADCSSGECGLSVHDDGCGTLRQFQCRDPAIDGCRVDADCAGEKWTTCGWDDTDRRFECMQRSCDIGRPLTVNGGARVAAATDRGDWVAGIAMPDVDAALRARLAEHWLANAAMEHASVASFARFTLELLALGAPPDLLADTQRAALDEVEHARLAYALASRFAGAELGPGPLSLDGVSPATDPEVVLDRLIREACVGETVGTALVREAARHVTDPALRAVLDRTAADETRHAALAWRALRWLVLTRPELAPSVPARFAAAVARLLAGLRADQAAPAAAYGLLGAEASEVVARDAILAVVEPCLEAAIGELLRRQNHG